MMVFRNVTEVLKNMQRFDYNGETTNTDYERQGAARPTGYATKTGMGELIVSRSAGRVYVNGDPGGSPCSCLINCDNEGASTFSQLTVLMSPFKMSLTSQSCVKIKPTSDNFNCIRLIISRSPRSPVKLLSTEGASLRDTRGTMSVPRLTSSPPAAGVPMLTATPLDTEG